MAKISSTDLDVFPVALGGNVFGWTANEAESFTNEGLSSLPYFALAKGFLTGKYRPNSKVQSARAESARAYLTEKGLRVLAALDEVAAEQIAPVASVALAWLAAQPTVVAPIASARTLSQLAEIMRSAEIHLSVAQLRKLSDASA